MAKQLVNIGAEANDKTGTPLRDAFDMINDNFNELYAEPSLTLLGNTLTLTKPDATTDTVDLAPYLDEDARAISSGTLNGATGIVTFTRDDATTFTLDLSGLLDDTNAVNSVNGEVGIVVLDTDDIAEGATNQYYTEARVSANTSVVANTAKVSNATHTGEVTGSTELTITNLAVTSGKLASNSVTNSKISANAVSFDKLDGALVVTSAETIASNDSDVSLPTSAAVIDYVQSQTHVTPGDATITLSAGAGLTGGAAFTTNQSVNETITLSHADTSSQTSVNNTGRTYIQDITLDTYGHITGITSATETVVDTNTIPNNATITLTPGDGLTGGGNFTTDQSVAEEIIFTVGVDNATTEISSDQVRVKDLGITTAKLANDAVTYAKLGAEFTTSAVISASTVNFNSSQVFTKTLTGTTAFTYSNASIGMVKDLVINANGNSFTLPTGTKIIAGTATTGINFIQVVVTASGEYWTSISQQQ